VVDSPTLRLTRLQLEALLVAARNSPNPADFALVAMLGLLGLRIFEACRADITDVGEEHSHRVLQVHGRPTSPYSSRSRLWSAGPSTQR
jgi:integrase/recombinase XerD